MKSIIPKAGGFVKLVEVVSIHRENSATEPETFLLTNGLVTRKGERRDSIVAMLLGDGYRHLSTVVLPWPNKGLNEVRESFVLAGRSDLSLSDIEI